MNIYGAVIVNGKLYEDNEIYRIPRTAPLGYGSEWLFDGDQLLNESNIVVSDDTGYSKTFKGMTALNDLHLWLNS